MENRLTGVQESIDDTRESLDDGKIVEVLRALQAAQGWALNRFTFPLVAEPLQRPTSRDNRKALPFPYPRRRKPRLRPPARPDALFFLTGRNAAG